MNDKISKIGNFCGRLILGNYADRIVETATKVLDMEKNIIEIKTDVKKIFDSLGGHDREIVGLKVKVYGSPGSPMQPNEKGIKLLTDSGFNEIYPKIKDEVFSILDKEKTRTLYDAEKNTIVALEKLSVDPAFDKIKNYAVNNIDEPLELIFTIASWIIRDDYAVIHPELLSSH